MSCHTKTVLHGGWKYVEDVLRFTADTLLYAVTLTFYPMTLSSDLDHF